MESKTRRILCIVNSMRCWYLGFTLALGMTACFSDPPEADAENDDDDGTGTESSTTSVSTSGPSSATSPSTASGTTSTTNTTMPTTNTTPAMTDGPGTTADPTRATSGTESSTTEAPGESESVGNPDECAGAGHVVFLSFDEVTLANGNVDDASSNESALFAGAYPAYTSMNRGPMVNALRNVFSDYDVCITEQRPPGEDYDMVVLTSLAEGAIVGYSVPDCSNSQPFGNVAVALAPVGDMNGEAAGYAVAGLIGNMLGLENVMDGSGDVMELFIGSNKSGLEFRDMCLPKASMSGSFRCAEFACGVDDQNSKAYLTTFLNL